MSQNENYTRHQSFNCSNNSGSNPHSSSQDGIPTSPKNNHRYSSSANSQPRLYASPEESDAVFPVFSTPTHMYLRPELNSQRYNTQSPKQQYAPSPVQTHYSATQKQQHNQNTPNGTQQQFTPNGYYEQNGSNPPSSPLR